MAENARPPVAVRIVRPYDTEEAFLESELETVGKTSVILIGAHARPQGVILRFEVTLQNGNVVLRGEGRVLQHKESAFRGQPGLALRFTRLDPKSKALVDRAGTIREARLAGSIPPMPLPAPPPPAPSSEPIASIASADAPSSVELSSSDLEHASEPAPPMETSAHDTRPPSDPPSAATAKPPPDPSLAPDPLLAMPSFAPLAIPSSLPSGASSSVPSSPMHPNATVAPDPLLASILTAPTPPPPMASAAPQRQPSDRPTSKPPPDGMPEAVSPLLLMDEAKTRPGKRAELQALVDEMPASAPSTVHATTPVAAPPLGEPPLEPRPEARAETKPNDTAVTRVADRDALLARLRERRASMTDQEKDDILRSR